ncbi:diguanylate cyclase response regulator [candidate division WOR-3 bacterium]|nr:diguanylate cyclase response regulator [candidate division WOR-3 bacterium]
MRSKMIGSPIEILLVEDNPRDTHLIREMLAEVRDTQLDLVCVERLSEGLERLSTGGIDVVLLDLSLLDSQGLDTFTKVFAQFPEVPIVVLTSLDDETLTVKIMQGGAQDYLVKGQVDSNLLVRSIRYAIERQRILAELRALSLTDELTGLYNRRGFLILAQQQLKMADRTLREMCFLFADIDNLKWINDTLGHHEGDLALIEIANILKETFRDSDIIARIGGDEFAVLVIETSLASAKILSTRLQDALDARNAKVNRSYNLSISLGITRYDPEHPCSIDEMLARADRLMYQQKQGR